MGWLKKCLERSEKANGNHFCKITLRRQVEVKLKRKRNENRLALRLALSLGKMTFYLSAENETEKLP